MRNFAHSTIEDVRRWQEMFITAFVNQNETLCRMVKSLLLIQIQINSRYKQIFRNRKLNANIEVVV